MKGVVFTELIEYLDAERSPAFTQEVLDAAALRHGGAYTAVGTYDGAELLSILNVVSSKTGTSIADLQCGFGRRLFSRLAVTYARLFGGMSDAFSLLGSIESYIHVEVKKLYPDAELPRFEVLERTPVRMRLIYRSKRHMDDFCAGLIEGCLEYFGEEGRVSRRILAREPASIVEFTIERLRA